MELCSAAACPVLAAPTARTATPVPSDDKRRRPCHGPVSTSECLRDHLAMLKGCPGAIWSGRVDFGTDGSGCARFHRAPASLAWGNPRPEGSWAVAEGLARPPKIL